MRPSPLPSWPSLLLAVAAAASPLALATASATASASASASEAPPEPASIDHGARLTAWLLAGGGYLDPSLSVRPVSPGSPFHEVVATAPIPAGSTLLSMPPDLLLRPDRAPRVGDEIGVWYEDVEEWSVGKVTNVSDDEEVLTVTFDDGETDEVKRYVERWERASDLEVMVGDRVKVYDAEEEEWKVGKVIELGKNRAVDVAYDDGTMRAHYADRSLWAPVPEAWQCRLVERLVAEAALGDASEYAPYLDYLESQPRGQFPGAWSEAGKDLLREVLGPIRKDETVNQKISDEPRSLLPPDVGTRTQHADGLLYGCRANRGASRDDVAFRERLKWFDLATQRSWDELMIGVFDMMNHGNGRLLNTINDPVEEGEPVMVYASRDIAAGEPIATSYNLCPDCEGRHDGYGTPEILAEYGFVEDYPQRWFFEEQDLAFELDRGEGGGGGREVRWLREGPPSLSTEEGAESFAFLREQVERLRGLSETVLADPAIVDAAYGASVPRHEYDTVVRYKDALVVAMTEALKSVGANDDGGGCATDGDDDEATSTCPARPPSYYDELEYEDPNYEPWRASRPPTCDQGHDDSRHPFHSDPRRNLEGIWSPYQEILFFENPNKNDDVCFMLDGVVQICRSYQPHYHEMIVHNTARYLNDDLKRVVFVGGGDSMLLYDIIKYPTLEKVVGLEIDQFVVRGSFKYFGTEPHWDQHEKVEWWFGDASKSLLMLPRDYFGSFDMVLVDLSETAASLTVTDHLNVMEALSLLLKPDGILVKNEYNYFPEEKDIFRDTLHLHYYNVPWVCSQSIIMSSNGIDFMRGKYTPREVEHMYNLLDMPELHYGFAHDYQRNYTNPLPYCEEKGDGQPTAQERSPGIVMVIEAEDSASDLTSTENVQKAVEEALKSHGLRVVKSSVPPTSPNVLVTFLQEGYLLTRLWPDEKYVGFDFLMWSSYENQEVAKNSLIEAVGSKLGEKKSSAYRVVTGGMFGVASWEEDEANRGPKLKSCDELDEEEAPKMYVQSSDMDAAVVAVQKSQVLVATSDGFTAAVLCGQGSDCKTAEGLKKVEMVSNVLLLNACEGIEDSAFTPDASRQMVDCEIEMWKAMREQVSKAGRIRSIVLDPSASHTMAQIFNSISKNEVNKKLLFDDKVAVTAPVMDSSEVWRRAFVDKFRTDIFPQDPTFRADVAFNSSSTSFLVAMASCGDSNFAERLVDFVSLTESGTGKMGWDSRLVGEIQSIRGSLWEGFTIQDPIDSSYNFTHADFDMTSQLDHWKSQRPLGLQTIFQFEMDKDKAADVDEQALKEHLEESLTTVVNSDELVYFETFSDAGDGALVTSFWSDGSAVLLWDGRMHIDINLFLNEESSEKAVEFEESFAASGITRTLKDTQPRGTGRVINVLEDLGGLDSSGKPVATPIWAAHLIQ